jgi:hypothetical protein
VRMRVARPHHFAAVLEDLHVLEVARQFLKLLNPDLHNAFDP